MEKPTLKIIQFEEGKYFFIKYKDENKSLLEKRMFIQRYSGECDDIKDSFEIISTFPVLNENGIDNEIECLELAKEAIKILKS